MPIKKYINTAEVAMLTGLQQDDIRNLAKTDVLPSHKNRRGHYRFNVDAVEKYFGIVINNIEQEAEPSALTENTSKESQDVDKVKYI
jgi:excisionase family DNA binding protein